LQGRFHAQCCQYCGGKAQAAGAQNFTLCGKLQWGPHAVIMYFIACLHHFYIGGILHVYLIHGELHIQRCAYQVLTLSIM